MKLLHHKLPAIGHTLLVGSMSAHAPQQVVNAKRGLGATPPKKSPFLLCFVDCEPIQGASPTWTIIGFLLAAAGVIAVFRSLKGRPQR
jgi:hypothetical protein